MAGASSAASYPRGGIAVILSGWPRVSETFALHELLALRRRGLLAAVFATKPGDASLVQPEACEVDDLVELLPDADVEAQVDRVIERLDGLGVRAVHGYFAHRPAEIAALAAARLGVPYGFSVHALDVRKVSAEVLAERCAGAGVVVSCNDDAAATIRAAGGDPVLVRHGVSLDRFRCPIAHREGPVSLLAVGRLVEKKGFPVLVDALRHLPAHVSLRIVGEGPQRDLLAARVADAGLGGRVELVGRRTHADLPDLYAAADIVVVPSVVDAAGDRDGLPNVVLEAMACGRAIVASDVAAIPSAIVDGAHGLLVPPGDAVALAGALGALVADPALRVRLGAAARARAEERFALRSCTDAFCDLLVERYHLDRLEVTRG